MQHYYTSKLFYGKYPYKITLARTRISNDPDFNIGWTVHAANVFLKLENIVHRLYTQIRGNDADVSVVTSNLFLSNQHDFDRCVAMWKPYVQSITSPYNEDHIDVLKNKTEIIIRDRLIYRKYRYIITFKRKYKEDISDLTEWVCNTFATSPSSVADAKWVVSGWNPKLYLKNDTDFVITKLTHSDRIRSILVICTFDELMQNPKKP